MQIPAVPNEHSTTVIPDHFGVRRGWRVWLLDSKGNLHSPYRDTFIWPALLAASASCVSDPAHVVPGRNCLCGIYVVADPYQALGWTRRNHLAADGSAYRLVLGEVASWGRIIEHRAAWRASRAYPQALYLASQDMAHADALSARYGVPVRSGSRFFDLYRLRQVWRYLRIAAPLGTGYLLLLLMHWASLTSPVLLATALLGILGGVMLTLLLRAYGAQHESGSDTSVDILIYAALIYFFMLSPLLILPLLK